MEQVPLCTFYGGGWNVFSNFSAYKVYVFGHDWMTSEHAYQGQKFAHLPHLAEIIFNARSAYETKQIAEKHSHLCTPEWKSTRLKIMEEILRAKLSQHPHIREKLLATGGREIVEDSPTDSFWGRGPDWKGQNNLGKIWMKLRDELRHGHM